MNNINQKEKLKSKRRFFILAAIAIVIAGMFFWESKAQKKEAGVALGSSVATIEETTNKEIAGSEEPAVNNQDNANQENTDESNSDNNTSTTLDKTAEKKTNQKTSVSSTTKHKKDTKNNKDDNKDNRLSYRLIIDNGQKKNDCRGKVGKGSNVFDALKDAGANCKFSVAYQNSSMGVFIESIGGIKNDFSTNKFWMFKVNGKMSDVGASSYKIKNKDVIEWDYMDTSNLF